MTFHIYELFQGVTDNDHDSLNLSEVNCVTSVIPGTNISGSASASILACDQTYNISSLNQRPTFPNLSDDITSVEFTRNLIQKLQEKDTKIQFLESKIQQLNQVINLQCIKKCNYTKHVCLLISCEQEMGINTWFCYLTSLTSSTQSIFCFVQTVTSTLYILTEKLVTTNNLC